MATGGGEVRLGAYHPQKLQSVGDRHAHVQDDGIRVYAVGELETRLCRQSGGDDETLELQHS
jgi:hypothetical protein